MVLNIFLEKMTNYDVSIHDVVVGKLIADKDNVIAT